MANIRTQTPPNLIGAPKVNIFNKEDFNAALWENGYDVILEEAVACPCKGQSSDNLVTCSNCLGTGWVFINPIRTKAFISSINRSTKYKDWSPEMIGTIAATFMDTNRISFMDKITMLNFTSEMSEVLSLRNYNSHKFVFCTYRVSYIKSIFLFSSENELLTLVDPSLYTINNNSFVVDIDSSVFPVGFNGKVSIRYRHRTTYNILDIPHDMRMTKEYSNNGTKSVVEMPIQCIARKSQYELGSVTNYEGDNVNDNSYLYSDISATVFPPITGEAPPLLKGNDGKSAYQSYLDTTTDNPPLSENAWIESLHGEDGTGGGGTSSDIIIPKLELRSVQRNVWESSYDVMDDLYAKWSALNTNFLQYNPQIWTYKMNNYTKIVYQLPLENNINVLEGSLWTILDPEVCSDLGNGFYHIEGNKSSVLLENSFITSKSVYRLSFDVSNYVEGSRFYSQIGTYTGHNKVIKGNGRYYQYIYSVNDNFDSLILFINGTVNFDISNIQLIECTGRFYRKRIKQWKHESHLNGVNFPNGKYYCSKSYHPFIPWVAENGRKTEFPNIGNNDQWYNFGIDVFDYIFAGNQHLNGVEGFRICEYPIISPNRRRSRFRFAIVIDNPNYPETSDNPKLRGPLSDIIELRLDRMSRTEQDWWYKITWGNQNLWKMK